MTILNSVEIPEVFTIIPTVFEDSRGYFMESFNEDVFNRITGVGFYPVQDNESCSSKGVIRGLHFQKPPFAQAKLVRVLKGSVYDVAVDLRKGSPTYGKWTGELLTADNHKQFFIPRGFAHGFVALEDNTIFQYKCDNYYNKESEGAVNYNDPEIGIYWDKISDITEYIVSEKDSKNKTLSELETPFIYE